MNVIKKFYFWNSAEALQKTLLFFKANRSMDLPNNNRIKWRGGSAMADSVDVDRDLIGGYYDADNHIKFNLSMSASNTMFAWGAIKYKQAYKQSGQLSELLDAVKWETDYFPKAQETRYGKISKL